MKLPYKKEQTLLPSRTIAQTVEDLNNRLRGQLEELGGVNTGAFEVRIVDVKEEDRKRDIAAAEAKALLAKHEGEVASIKATHALEIAQLKGTHDAALAEIARQLAEAKARSEVEIGYLKAEVEHLRAQNGKLAERPTTVEVKAEPVVGIVHQPGGQPPKFYQERPGGNAQPQQKGHNPPKKEE